MSAPYVLNGLYSGLRLYRPGHARPDVDIECSLRSPLLSGDHGVNSVLCALGAFQECDLFCLLLPLRSFLLLYCLYLCETQNVLLLRLDAPQVAQAGVHTAAVAAAVATAGTMAGGAARGAAPTAPTPPPTPAVTAAATAAVMAAAPIRSAAGVVVAPVPVPAPTRQTPTQRQTRRTASSKGRLTAAASLQVRTACGHAAVIKALPALQGPLQSIFLQEIGSSSGTLWKVKWPTYGNQRCVHRCHDVAIHEMARLISACCCCVSVLSLHNHAY